MPNHLRSIGSAVLCSGLAATLGACAGADISTGSIAPYEAANSFYPYGYQDTAVAENQHRVTASGSGWASKARLEKIALTRAAEIGFDKKKPFFKVGTVTHGVVCSKKTAATHKGRESPESNRPTVTLDVTYSDTASDPGFRDTKASLAEYKTAMEADTGSAEASQLDELKAQCGGA